MKDFTGLKRSDNQTAMITYLKNIPVAQIEAYFKRTEVESETLSAILETVELGLTTNGDCEWASSFLLSLAKADNFELTLSFSEDSDKERIKKIFSKIKTTLGEESETKLAQLEIMYTV